MSGCGPSYHTTCRSHIPTPMGNRALIFQAPPFRIEPQALSVFFTSPKKKKKKKTTKVLASVCPKAGRQDRMWENCHHLLPKYQPSTGAVRQQHWGQPGTTPTTRMSPCPWRNQLRCFWCQAKVLCSGKAFAFPKQLSLSKGRSQRLLWEHSAGLRYSNSDLKGSSSSSSTQNPRLAGMEEQQEPARPRPGCSGSRVSLALSRG